MDSVQSVKPTGLWAGATTIPRVSRMKGFTRYLTVG